MNLNRTETVLNRCREIMSERINVMLLHVFGYAEALMHERASREKGSAGGKLYTDGVRVIRLKKHEMQTRFKNSFTLLFQNQVRNLVRGGNNTDVKFVKDASKFQVNGNNGQDHETLQSTVEQVRGDCHLALLNLDNRISQMLQDARIDSSNNPFRPETIFDAFWESCRDSEIKPEIRMMLLKLFEHFMALELGYLYEDLNTYLARQDIESRQEPQLS